MSLISGRRFFPKLNAKQTNAENKNIREIALGYKLNILGIGHPSTTYSCRKLVESCKSMGKKREAILYQHDHDEWDEELLKPLYYQESGGRTAEDIARRAKERRDIAKQCADAICRMSDDIDLKMCTYRAEESKGDMKASWHPPEVVTELLVLS